MAQGIQKRLTVTFQDVVVEVDGVGEDYGATVASVARALIPFGKSKVPRRHILQGVSGQVSPGEMLLVLGRPGSGCTSLLKIISNHREEFANVSGDVQYGNIGPKQAKQFRHQIVMNTEDDVHFPTLKVSEAIGFASATKVPAKRPDPQQSADSYIESATDEILSSLGIEHTKDTLVGNEFVRGVSGGERKRVSLAEVLATQAPLQCWDNSTRGLDASNALDFAKLLRRAADEQSKTIVSTLYQAGNGIYDQFDKALVLAEGREIYYGPTSEAKAYFEDMGFVCTPGANTADFLTAVAVHTERRIAPGYEGQVPNTAEEFERRYKESALFQRMTAQIESIKNDEALAHEIADLEHARELEKNRQFQIIWGDRLTNGLSIFSAICLAFVTGSLFYHLSSDSTSAFTRPGALYFPILLFALNTLSEVQASFLGRPIVSRQKRLAFARPSAFSLANTIIDIPLVIFLVSLFLVAFYFMVDFQWNAGKFFTMWILLIVTILSFMALFRMIGAWCMHYGIASQIAGFTIMVAMVYTGYLIPLPSMHVWFRWISYINPGNYCFRAFLASEMGNRVMECVEPQYVPYGESYTDPAYRSCNVQGATAGASTINGGAYVDHLYGAKTSEVWPNFGIIVGLWIFFSLMAALGLEINLSHDAGSKILFDRRSRQRELAELEDAEKSLNASDSSSDGEEKGITTGQTIFTFKDIDYYVQHMGKEKQLLQKVSGYVKPGQLVALMGSSGAGKTTLMDALAQRKDSGRLEGSIMVNGRPQGIDFQRTTGYCEQNDVHEPNATVSESLLFSARLRQNYDVPDDEKKEYVRRIMDLLELTPLQHALVGSPGSGLSIEQRKRLTLAVELVAKPSLLFLDEPTSGLDGQSAFEICRFMRKLVAAGQTIICTIHQPSGPLFEAFDVLLLLARGGRTTYFGPMGEHSSTVLDYFARHGAPCAEHVNPAEHIVDVVQGRQGDNIDWPQEWLDSEEYRHTMAELDELNRIQISEKSDTAAGEEKVAIDFATPIRHQLAIVTRRQLLALWRSPDYIWNKIGLHVFQALFAGFTFWMIGDGTFDLQLRLMSIFNFVFVAPACINQLQPLFIQNRSIFETREKKSKVYHWLAFITAQLLSEIPVLILCGTLYFACWYFTSGFPVTASHSGQVYLQMILYEFLYTSIGQAIAAYSPDAYFAALANPLIIGGALINFTGVVVPYDQMEPFWRYWMYYLDPFQYLVGGLLVPVTWDVQVQCKQDEFTYISVPSNSTCGEYMYDFLSTAAGYVADPSNSSMCAYCEYSTGADYLRTFNLNEKYYGWRDDFYKLRANPELQARASLSPFHPDSHPNNHGTQRNEDLQSMRAMPTPEDPLYYGASSNFAFLQQVHRDAIHHGGAERPAAREMEEGGAGLDMFVQRSIFFGTPLRVDATAVPAPNTPLNAASYDQAKIFIGNFKIAARHLIPFFTEAELEEMLLALYHDGENASVFPQRRGMTLAVLAIGALCTPQTEAAEGFYIQAKQVLALYDEAVTVPMVQLSMLLAVYQLNMGRPNSAYLQLGVACRKAFALGLHKDAVGAHAREGGLQRHRATMWCLYFHEGWQALVLGREAGMKMADISCPFPDDQPVLSSLCRLAHIAEQGAQELCAVLLHDVLWHPSKHAYNLDYINIALQCLDDMVNDEPVTNARESIRQVLHAVERSASITRSVPEVQSMSTQMPDGQEEAPSLHSHESQSGVQYPSMYMQSMTGAEQLIYYSDRYRQQPSTYGNGQANTVPDPGMGALDPLSDLDTDIFATDLWNFFPTNTWTPGDQQNDAHANGQVM
ncbi:hypothetical protein LTR85_010930 [Meristemomyces frigidus]|nr:hypothetical protein LTR85_010930 [Meristemomyces frigidus]